MAQLDTTQTWSTGDTVTAAKLNQMITGATVRSEIISNQVEQTAAANSSDMVVIESGGSLYKLSVGTLSQSPVWDANKIQSKAVASTAPTDGQVLIWDNANTQWSPSDVSASTLAANSVGASELADNAVDTAAIVDGAVSAAKLDSGINTVPSGTIIMYGASAAPTNWLLCHGEAVSRTDYSALFGIIGTTYGTGDGSTTFNLPDLRSRMPVGIGDGDAGGTALTDRSLGDTGGTENVTLTESQLPAHNHWGGLFTQQGYNFTGNGIETRTSGWGGKSIDGWRGAHGTGGPQQTSTQDAGGGDAHNNLPPFLAINFIIRI